MNLLFLDIETTGLDPEKSELIELSAVRLSPDFQDEVALFDELIKPPVSIPPFITKLTGISDKMVENAPDIEVVKKDFQKFLREDDIIVGHNITFDTGFLNHKGFYVPNKTLDTFPLANILLPDEQSYSLEILTEKYEVAHEDAHRALADVRANVEIFRILFERARSFPEGLLQKFQKVISHSSWTGSEFFAEAFQQKLESGNWKLETGEKKRKEKLEKIDGGDTEHCISTVPVNLFEEKKQMHILPPVENSYETALSWAEKTVEKSVAIAVPRLEKVFVPDTFCRFTSPERIFCSSVFEEWYERKLENKIPPSSPLSRGKQSVQESLLDKGDLGDLKLAGFTDDEAIILLKLFRHQFFGGSPFLTDFPMVRTEWDLVNSFGQRDHSNCSDDCPAKKFQLDVETQCSVSPLFICEYGDISSVPAENILVARGEKVLNFLNKKSSTNISVKHLEKAISSVDEKTKEDVLFHIGLLKRFFRERVGESPYAKHYVLQKEDFGLELRNLAEQFWEFGRGVACNTSIEIAEFLSHPPEENTIKFATIHRDDNLFLGSGKISLDQEFLEYFPEEKNIAFLSSNFLELNPRLKSGVKFSLGFGVPKISAQHLLDDHNNYSQKGKLFTPTQGGNTKTDNANKTVDVLLQVLKKSEKNILVILPSMKMIEQCIEKCEKEVQEHGYESIVASVSTGKISAMISRGKTVVFASAHMLSRIDFSSADFEYCIQHRLLFDPPGDPLLEVRTKNVRNEFSDVALPKAVQNFYDLFTKLLSMKREFFWIQMDSHFQKRGGFAEEFVAVLPESFEVVRGDVNNYEF